MWLQARPYRDLKRAPYPMLCMLLHVLIQYSSPRMLFRLSTRYLTDDLEAKFNSCVAKGCVQS